MLLQELRALLAEDFDLGLIGIPEDELDALLADADDRPAIPDDAADAVPDLPAEPITKPADIWALGQHRLCCGGATDPAVVARLMQNEAATPLFTSPPYAQQRDYGAAKERVGDWNALMQSVFTAARVTADAQLVVNLGLVHRGGEWIPYWEGWVAWMRAQGWRWFGWYVSDQGPGLPGDWNGRLAPSHEFIFHFNRAPCKPHKTVPSKHAGKTLGGGGLRGTDGTVYAKTGTGNAIHATASPTLCSASCATSAGWAPPDRILRCSRWRWLRQCWRLSLPPATLVFEPFCGSGTQIVAAERAGRRCFAMELDPVYCDVAVRRWELATEKRPELAGS